jgi:hypothetical protein
MWILEELPGEVNNWFRMEWCRMNKLFQDSGGTNEDRVKESNELLKRIAEVHDNLNPNELNFVESLYTRNTYVSPKQIFWLRDICTKYDV